MGSWDTELGLMDNFNFVIMEAYFTTLSTYNSGDGYLLMLKGNTDDPDSPTTEVAFSCGKGWLSVDGGKTVKNEKGRMAFNRSSMYGKFIERCKELGVGPTLASRGESYEAKVWIGLTFHMEMEEITFGKNLEARNHLMPTDWIQNGVAAAISSSAPASASSPAPAPVVSYTAATVPALAIPPVLLAQAKMLRKKAASYEEWFTACMDLKGAEDSESFIGAIVDPEGLWKDLA